MSYEEYGPFKVGGVQFPLRLAASTGKTLLADGDPGIAALLAYLPSVLEIHLGARWVEAVTEAKLSAKVGGVDALLSKIVGSAFPFDVGPYLTVIQSAFPILAIFPLSEVMSEHTRTRHKTDGEIAVQWIMPPLQPDQALKLITFRRLVSRVLLNRTEQGWDPEHESGAEVFGAAGIMSIAFRGATYGFIPATTRGAVGSPNTFYPFVEFSVSLTERREDVFAEVGVEGFDAGVSVKDEAGDVPLIEADIPLNGGL